MKPARSLIPVGTATLLPQTAQRVRELEDQLLAYVATWGYQEIILPTFEYLDVLSVGLSSDILEKCYKFADWSSGRMLVLRPDATAQIARMVAMGLGGDVLPMRFSYRTTVFRHELEHRGREREVFQVGVELVGNDSSQGDAEMVTMLAGFFKEVGLPDWKISLGHAGFFKALLSRSGLSVQGRKQAEIAAAHKDLPRLDQILTTERVAKNISNNILQVPERCGQRDVLEWAQKVAGKDAQLLRPLRRLEQVFQQLVVTGVEQHVLLDLGELRGFDYYDGVVFDVFTSALGHQIGGGGRYNHLVGRFGRDLPAIGFGLDLDRVFSALERSECFEVPRSGPVLLVTVGPQTPDSFSLAQNLRAMGIAVIEEQIAPNPKSARTSTIQLARRCELSHAILYERTKGAAGPLHLFEFSTSSVKPRQTRVTQNDLFTRLQEAMHGDF